MYIKTQLPEIKPDYKRKHSLHYCSKALGQYYKKTKNKKNIYTSARLN